MAMRVSADVCRCRPVGLAEGSLLTSLSRPVTRPMMYANRNLFSTLMVTWKRRSVSLFGGIGLAAFITVSAQ